MFEYHCLETVFWRVYLIRKLFGKFKILSNLSYILLTFKIDVYINTQCLDLPIVSEKLAVRTYMAPYVVLASLRESVTRG